MSHGRFLLSPAGWILLNRGMGSQERTKRIYDRRPYPAVGRSVLTDERYNLPAMEWIQAIGRTGQPAPRRVLVAGCGSGAEAFGLRRRLPEAEIVAVDFSPKSIALARRLQRSAGVVRPIRFLVGDLTDPCLAEQTGGNFDLITSHGVLTYIPNPGRALTNLATCLQPEGALYLGVNGAGHPAVRLREWLPTFGLGVEELGDEGHLRALLRLWDSMHGDDGVALAELSVSYLSGDICGAHFNNWSLHRWKAEVNAAGWDVAGTWLLPPSLRQTLPSKAYRPLFPDGIGDVAASLDGVRPASFHRMMLRRRASVAAPWDDPAAAVGWRLRWSGLYTLRVETGRPGAEAWAVLRSPTQGNQLDWPLTRVQAITVREWARDLARGRPTTSGWPARWGRSVAARRTLWLWAGFGIITMFPPEN